MITRNSNLIHYSILAGRKESGTYRENIDRISSMLMDNSKITVFYPDSNIPDDYKNEKYSFIEFIDSTNLRVSEIRNISREKTLSGNFRYDVMIEDDIEIIDPDGVHNYIDMMTEYKLNVAFYAFGSKMNRVFTRPNPNVVITKKVDGEVTDYLYTVGKPCTQFIIIDRSKCTTKFDADLEFFETRDFFIKAAKNNDIPFLGLFFDLPYSHKYFSAIDSSYERCRNLNVDALNAEKSKLEKLKRWEWKANLQVNALLKYIAECKGLSCKV